MSLDLTKPADNDIIALSAADIRRNFIALAEESSMTGHGAPTASAGQIGCLYFDIDTNEIWKKTTESGFEKLIDNTVQYISYSNSTYLNGSIHVYKVGRIVHIVYRNDLIYLPERSYVTIATLNSAYRPIRDITFSPRCSTQPIDGSAVYIYTNGEIIFYNNQAITSTRNWQFTCCYISAS